MGGHSQQNLLHFTESAHNFDAKMQIQNDILVMKKVESKVFPVKSHAKKPIWRDWKSAYDL